MTKEKLAFVDYWHHKYTRSGDFLRNILSEEFEITNFWWKPKEKFPIQELSSFKNIFFFHVMFPYQAMRTFLNKKILWAPMYDALIFKNKFEKKIFWRQISLLGIKVLEFSKKISESIDGENIELLKLKYYIKSEQIYNYRKDNKIRVFFWDRGQIKIDDWIKLFDLNQIDKIIYYPMVDPSRKIVNKIENYPKEKIEIINKKFLPKNEYLELMKNCNVFIAPRRKEGIGMSIVEAISKGMYIVGYNEATMNEYITNDKIGYLFGKNSKNLNLNNILNFYDFRLNEAQLNYKNWISKKDEIIPFFKKNKIENKKRLFDNLLIYDDLKFFLKKILKKNRFIY